MFSYYYYCCSLERPTIVLPSMASIQRFGCPTSSHGSAAGTVASIASTQSIEIEADTFIAARPATADIGQAFPAGTWPKTILISDINKPPIGHTGPCQISTFRSSISHNQINRFCNIWDHGRLTSWQHEAQCAIDLLSPLQKPSASSFIMKKKLSQWGCCNQYSLLEWCVYCNVIIQWLSTL